VSIAYPKVIEAEVATLISRGDTLVLFTHRTDVKSAEGLQKRVAQLRQAWKALKQKADVKRAEAQKLEDDLSRLARGLDELLSWMGRAERALTPGESPAAATAIRATADQKRRELRRLEDMANSFKKDSLGSNGTVLAAAKVQWERLQPKLRSQSSKDTLKEESALPKLADLSADASEVLSRISKVRPYFDSTSRTLMKYIFSFISCRCVTPWPPLTDS